jgi:hypothetical protein
VHNFLKSPISLDTGSSTDTSPCSHHNKPAYRVLPISCTVLLCYVPGSFAVPQPAANTVCDALLGP